MTAPYSVEPYDHEREPLARWMRRQFAALDAMLDEAFSDTDARSRFAIPPVDGSCTPEEPER